jgi:hypothetical protein
MRRFILPVLFFLTAVHTVANDDQNLRDCYLNIQKMSDLGPQEPGKTLMPTGYAVFITGGMHDPVIKKDCIEKKSIKIKVWEREKAYLINSRTIESIDSKNAKCSDEVIDNSPVAEAKDAKTTNSLSLISQWMSDLPDYVESVKKLEASGKPRAKEYKKQFVDWLYKCGHIEANDDKTEAGRAIYNIRNYARLAQKKLNPGTGTIDRSQSPTNK